MFRVLRIEGRKWRTSRRACLAPLLSIDLLPCSLSTLEQNFFRLFLLFIGLLRSSISTNDSITDLHNYSRNTLEQDLGCFFFVPYLSLANTLNPELSLLSVVLDWIHSIMLLNLIIFFHLLFFLGLVHSIYVFNLILANRLKWALRFLFLYKFYS